MAWLLLKQPSIKKIPLNAELIYPTLPSKKNSLEILRGVVSKIMCAKNLVVAVIES